MNYSEQAVRLSDPGQEALKRTLDIVCGKWKLLIIFQLSEQARRYGELRRSIPDISEKILIQELKVLVALGVLRKTIYSTMPPRVDYGLTERARRVLPILLQLKQVGEVFTEPSEVH